MSLFCPICWSSAHSKSFPTEHFGTLWLGPPRQDCGTCHSIFVLRLLGSPPSVAAPAVICTQPYFFCCSQPVVLQLQAVGQDPAPSGFPQHRSLKAGCYKNQEDTRGGNGLHLLSELAACCSWSHSRLLSSLMVRAPCVSSPHLEAHMILTLCNGGRRKSLPHSKAQFLSAPGWWRRGIYFSQKAFPALSLQGMLLIVWLK